jgi:hypothetical protein
MMCRSMKKPVALLSCLVFIMLALNFSVSYAQDSCATKLKQAKELFESGQIEQIPSLLDSCLQNGFSKDEKIQASRLLIQVYLFDSNLDMARQTMTRFLHDFPEYKSRPDDPAEFIELYKSIKIKTTWGLGFSAGTNMSQVTVVEHFSTENLNKLNSKYSPNGFGIDAGLHINRYFSSYLWLSLDIRYSMMKLKRTDILGNNLEELTYSEKTDWLTSPLYLNVSFGKGKFSPYLFAGGEFGYLFISTSDIRRHNLTDNTVKDVVKHSKNTLRNREPINVWASGGIGLQYKVPGGYFNMTLGYNYCLLPYVNKKNRYTDNDNLFYYQYIDDDFKINRYFCSLGYTKLFYKIKNKRINNAETSK